MNHTSFWTFDWDAEVPDEVRDRLFEKVVSAVRRWRLEMPAVLFLEINAPLGFLLGQGTIFLSPLLAVLFLGGLADVQRCAKLLHDRENFRLLADRIAQGETDAAR